MVNGPDIPSRSQQPLRSPYFDPELFYAQACPIGLFYGPSADRPLLYYNNSFSAAILKGSEDKGLVFGHPAETESASGKRRALLTLAASGVPVNRHVLISLTSKHANWEIIYPLDSDEYKRIACCAMLESPGAGRAQLRFKEEYYSVSAGMPRSLIDASHEYVLIKNGASFFRKFLPREEPMPSFGELVEKFPGCLLIADSSEKVVYTFTPLHLQLAQDFGEFAINPY